MQSDEADNRLRELEFFRDYMTALDQQDYRGALEAIKKGLDEAGKVAGQLSSLYLILTFQGLVSLLEFNLEKAYGDRWEKRIDIPPIPPEERQIFRCSFCGKADSEVAKLIAGGSAYICNECIGICNEILDEALATGPPAENS